MHKTQNTGLRLTLILVVLATTVGVASTASGLNFINSLRQPLSIVKPILRQQSAGDDPSTGRGSKQVVMGSDTAPHAKAESEMGDTAAASVPPAALPSGWVLPTASSNFCGYFGWLGYSSAAGGYHLAQDMCNPKGAPVYSIGDGDVIYSSTQVGGYGSGGARGGALVVRYRAADGAWFTALYGHLDNPRGSGHVSAGEVIGYSNTYSPPHLHFAIHPGFDAASPNPYIGYTSNRSVTYGFVEPISFLNAHPRGQAGGDCGIAPGQGSAGAELSAFQNVYNNSGGRTVLGCADSAVRTDGFGSFTGTRGHYQTFTNGGVKSEIDFITTGSRANQTYAVLGPFYAKWAALLFVKSNPMGYPIENQSGESTTCYGTRLKYQSFEGGSLQHLLSGPKAGSVYEVHGAIHAKWRIKGYAGCPLGSPISDESDARPSGKSGRTGKLNAFEGGHIYFLNGSSQAYEVHGAIYKTYVEMGGTASPLGFPVSDEYVVSGYARSDFEGGHITTTDGVHYRAFTNTQTACGDASAIRQSVLRLNQFLSNHPLPEYLPAASVVNVIHSFRLQSYDELYYSALDLRGLTGTSLGYAARALSQGDTSAACKYLQQAARYQRLMTDTESTAVLVWQTRVSNVSDVIRSIYEGSKQGVIFGVDYLGLTAGLGPKAGLAAEMLYLPLDFTLDRSMYGEEEAVVRLKDKLMTDVLVKVIIRTVRLPQLNNRTIHEYVEKGVSHTVGRSQLYNLLETASKDPNFHRELVKALAFVMSSVSTAEVERIATELEQNFIDALRNGSVSPLEPPDDGAATAAAESSDTPIVLNTFPAKGAAYVDVNLASISVNFGGNVLPNTKAVSVADAKGRAVPVAGTSVSGNVFSVSLGAALSRGTAYTVTLHSGAVTSTSGVGSEQLIWGFTTSPSPLAPGGKVTISNTGGVGLHLRRSPALAGDNSNVIMTLPEGSTASLVGGPTQADGYAWWNIQSSGQTGWAAVGDWLKPSDTNGLRIGAEVAVANTSGVGLRLRGEPGIDGEIITTLAEGTGLTIISGPFYVDGHLWWNVKSAAGTGYCAVAYWLFPEAQTETGSLKLTVVEATGVQVRDWNQSVVYSLTVTDANGNLIDAARITGSDALQGTPVITTFPETYKGFVSYGTRVPEGKADGNYDITFKASKDGYTESTIVTRQVQVYHPPGPTPTPTPTYTIHGRVADAYGNGIPGVNIVYGGAGVRPDDAFTDAQGYYEIRRAYHGITYNVTPLKTGYTFSPPSRRFDTIAGNQIADFLSVATAPTAPVLLTETGTDKAIAVESVTRTRDPFPQNARSNFSADGRPRVMLFATNLTIAPGEGFADLIIEAEDSAHRSYPLTIEYAGNVPGTEAITSIVVRPNDQMIEDGDVWVSIKFRGVESNRARVTFSAGAQPSFLSLLEGNPGTPGDGVLVGAAGGQLDQAFEFISPLSLRGHTDGLTLTVFMPPGAPNLKSSSFNIISLKPPGQCQASFGGGGAAVTGKIVLNGIQGSFINVTQSDLDAILRGANSFYPGCNFTADDLYIGKVYLYPEGSTGQINVTSLDAIAIGRGQNNFLGLPVSLPRF